MVRERLRKKRKQRRKGKKERKERKISTGPGWSEEWRSTGRKHVYASRSDDIIENITV
jgi:hypothetical protein